MRRSGIKEVASLAFKAAYFIRMREVFKLKETTLTEMANISVSEEFYFNLRIVKKKLPSQNVQSGQLDCVHRLMRNALYSCPIHALAKGILQMKKKRARKVDKNLKYK